MSEQEAKRRACELPIDRPSECVEFLSHGTKKNYCSVQCKLLSCHRLRFPHGAQINLFALNTQASDRFQRFFCTYSIKLNFRNYLCYANNTLLTTNIYNSYELCIETSYFKLKEFLEVI